MLKDNNISQNVCGADKRKTSKLSKLLVVLIIKEALKEKKYPFYKVLQKIVDSSEE